MTHLEQRKAVELRAGEQIRLLVSGGTEVVSVESVESLDGEVRLTLWSSVMGSIEDIVPSDMPVTVLR